MMVMMMLEGQIWILKEILHFKNILWNVITKIYEQN